MLDTEGYYLFYQRRNINTNPATNHESTTMAICLQDILMQYWHNVIGVANHSLIEFKPIQEIELLLDTTGMAYNLKLERICT